MKTTLIAAAFAVLASLPAYAQGMGQGMDHSGHSMPMQSQTSAAPSTKGYQDAAARMHKDMEVTFSGNADVDFVRGMIPHHQGAIDMAKVVLTYGKDPQLKKLAQDIIAAQEKEIAEMQDWLKKNAK